MNKFLIVGLGNPGLEYDETRHNIGFKVVDVIAEKHGVKFSNDRLGAVCNFKLKGKPVVLIKPSTYMNLSGKAVNYWMQAEKISIENILVITDDLALPLGALRMKGKGSDGGHNGLKSIQSLLNSTEYPRLRFGVGNDFAKGFQVDFVLGKWTKDEQKLLEPRIELAVQMIEAFINIGIQRAMSAYNNK